MPELLGKNREAKEAAGHKELIPTAVDRIPTPFGDITVIRGKNAAGEDVAIVRGVEQVPLELLLGDDNPEREGGFLTKLKNHPVMQAVNLVGLAASGLAMAACSTDIGHGGSNHAEPSFGVQSSALTVDQLGNIKGQVVPWSDWGEIPENFATMNGKNYILLGNTNSNSDWNNVTYVECDKLADCLSASAQKNHVEGLNEAGLFGSFAGAGIYQDKDGKYKFIVTPEGDGEYEGDVVINPATGKLAASNFQFVNPPMGESSIVYENGVPHALHMGLPITDVNLWDKSIKKIPLISQCAAPTVDGNLAIVAHSQQEVNGTMDCILLYADSLDNLATKAAEIVSLKNVNSKQLSNTHLTTDKDGSGVFLYSVAETPPGQIDPQTRIYVGLMMAKPATPVDADATGDSTGDADAGASPDTDANGSTDAAADVVAPADVPTPADAAALDAAAETADAIDAIVFIDASDPDLVEVDAAGNDIPPDLAQDIPPELPPDIDQPDVQEDTQPKPDAEITQDTTPPVDAAADISQPEPDITPVDIAADNQTTPEVTPSACDFAKGKINVKIGDCTLENCKDPIADIKGKCTTEIDLGNPNPVVLELDGTYSVDLLEKFGTHLAGKYTVTDNGNNWGTVMGPFTTAVEGTKYSGEFPDQANYAMSCQEGRITVYWSPTNGQKQKLATFEAGQGQIFDIKDPIKKGDDISQAEPNKSDAGTTGAETSGPETSASETASIDGGTPAVETPRSPGGCSVNNVANSHAAILSLVLLSMASLIRRRNKALAPVKVKTKVS